jgi:hypothetical protein
MTSDETQKEVEGELVSTAGTPRRVTTSFAAAGVIVLTIPILLLLCVIVIQVTRVAGVPFGGLLALVPVYLWWAWVKKWARRRNDAVYLWGPDRRQYRGGGVVVRRRSTAPHDGGRSGD